MWLPVLRGFLDRRILVNYRVDPEFMQKCLPAPFRPKVVNGYGMAGVCLIRMNRIGPRFLPFPLVRSSENGALRFAVEWEQDGTTYEGVFIPARYTTSRVAALAGTRLFPGRHYMAQFQVEETPDHFRIQLDSAQLQLTVSARLATEFSGSQVFASLEDASTFFRNGALGYSEARRAGKFDGVELRIFDWKMSPLTVEQVACDFFDDTRRFPPGTAAFDHALLMRGLNNEFHGLRSFCCLTAAEAQPQPLLGSAAAREAKA
jgi:hypothetical protein